MSNSLAKLFTANGRRFYPPGELFNLADLNQRRRFDNETTIRALCTSAYLGEDSALCRVLGRYKMYVDTRDEGLSSHLMLDGYWEMWVTEVLAAIVKPGMVTVDIGANLGYFTMLLADLVGPTGQVHAFEPNVELAGRLTRSANVNGFRQTVSVYPQALAEDERDVVFVVPPGEPKNGHIRTKRRTRDMSLPVIRTRRLDSYPDIATADVIKIDADTAEQRIWRGMTGIFAQVRPLTVLLEFAASRYRNAGAFLDEIVAEGFALACIAIEGGVHSATRDELLAAPRDEDQMLMLTRG